VTFIVSAVVYWVSYKMFPFAVDAKQEPFIMGQDPECGTEIEEKL